MLTFTASRAQVGKQFVTTLHAINSALLKLTRVSTLPPSRNVFRGFSGLKIPHRFLNPDARGCRGGVEFGYLSTSASKAQAIGYIKLFKGMPQLYQFSLGQVDCGASISWISYFPGEEEVCSRRA